MLDVTGVKIHPTESPGNAGIKGKRSDTIPRGKLLDSSVLQQEHKRYQAVGISKIFSVRLKLISVVGNLHAFVPLMSSKSPL